MGYPILVIFLIALISYVGSKHIQQTRILKEKNAQVSLIYKQTFRDVFDGIQVKGRVRVPKVTSEGDLTGLLTSIDSLAHKI